MQNRVIVLALLGSVWITARPMRAQQTPTAVIADPAADKQFPPGLSVLTIPSNGSEMDAFLYLAAGPSPHGTVVLLHGLPGYKPAPPATNRQAQVTVNSRLKSLGST
jgi:hypothetical protein